MRKDCARQVCTVSRGGRQSLFQVGLLPLPASHQSTPAYLPSACGNVALFCPRSSQMCLQMLKFGRKAARVEAYPFARRLATLFAGGASSVRAKASDGHAQTHRKLPAKRRQKLAEV